MYGWRSITQVVPLNSRIQFLAGNSNRVSLLACIITAGSLRMAYSGGAPGVDVWAAVIAAGQQAFTFRDYGSIMQAEVWLENVQAANITAAITELYRIPEC